MSKFRNKSYELLQRLPAFRYTKPPVDTVAELYERYPNGVERSTVAFVNEKNTWYVYQTEGSLKGQWIPVAIDGASIPGVDLALVATTGQAKDLLGLAVVGLTGQYSDLTGLPVGGLPIVSDVTAMFTTNSTARFSARMTGHEDGKKVIELFGEDTSGGTNDLIITPAIGFGPDNSEPINVREYASPADTAPTDYKVTVVAASGSDNGSLTVPNGCAKFYFAYFVGVAQSGGDPTDPQPSTPSYWISSNGTYYPFSIADTQLSAFSNYPSTTYGLYIYINGQMVNVEDIKEIVFGSDYSGETIVNQNFILYASFLEKIVFTGLMSVSFISDHFLRDAIRITELVLSPFANSLVRIGDLFCNGCKSLRSIDLRPLVNVVTYGYNFMVDCYQLASVQIGSLDFSTKTVSQANEGGFKNAGAGLTSGQTTLYADSNALAQAFKDKFPNAANWPVVINS